MHIRASAIKGLVKTYLATKRSHPRSIRLPAIKRQIVLALLQDNHETKKSIQMTFLRRLHRVLASKKSIEAAIKGRRSIPNFTHLEDCDFSTLEFDRNRVEFFLKEYLGLKKENIRHPREAIMIEAALFEANTTANMPFSIALMAQLSAPDYALDPDIALLANSNSRK